MGDFRGPCPRCGKLLNESVRRCECGALTGLSPRARAPRLRAPRLRLPRLPVSPAPDPRPSEATSGRYIVRECEGYEFSVPIRPSGSNARTSIECVVLDTAWNHRLVASFRSQNGPSYFGRAAMFRWARDAAVKRCDELNRADERSAVA